MGIAVFTNLVSISTQNFEKNENSRKLNRYIYRLNWENWLLKTALKIIRDIFSSKFSEKKEYIFKQFVCLGEIYLN